MFRNKNHEIPFLNWELLDYGEDNYFRTHSFKWIDEILFACCHFFKIK